MRAEQRTHRKFPPPVSAASQVTVLCSFFAVVFSLYLVPLTISSPCIMEKKDLGPKPALIGHRGAPMVSGPRRRNQTGDGHCREDPEGNGCDPCGSRAIGQLDALSGVVGGTEEKT